MAQFTRKCSNFKLLVVVALIVVLAHSVLFLSYCHRHLATFWENSGVAEMTNKRNILAFFFYGNNTRYTDGAMDNIKLAAQYYPGWTVRIYYNSTVPKSIIQKVQEQQQQQQQQRRQEEQQQEEKQHTARVELKNMDGSNLFPMTWRFAAASDLTVGRLCSRDIDSRLSLRDAAAVQEWVKSSKDFHVMRDHLSHALDAISGGLWCAKTDAIRDMDKWLLEYTHEVNDKYNKAAEEEQHSDSMMMMKEDSTIDRYYMLDMTFLKEKIWPNAQESIMQHDSVSCTSWGAGSRPFPTKRKEFEHVGAVYVNGRMRYEDIAVLRKRDLPPECQTEGNGHTH